MKHNQLERRFKEFLKARRTALQMLSPTAGVEAMLAFYEGSRVEGLAESEDSDMLLFQWGTYDWGEGPRFELDITRQVILPEGDDDGMFQLHLTFRFQPEPALTALGKGNRWCHGTTELAAFTTYVLEHPALRAVGTRADATRELWFDTV